MLLKDQLRQWQNSNVPAKRWSHYIAKAVWRTWQFLSVPELRSQRITGWRFPNQYYQRSPFTAPNRYPDLFEQCRMHLASNPEARVLSFGCAMGEEVFSLAEYLPSAAIIGVDINTWCIRQCRLKRRSDMHFFYERFSREFEQLTDLDTIFCMAVFQRTENRTLADNSVSTGITFEQFEREIGQLDAKLKIGGLFVIDHADFDFRQTEYGGRYDILNFEQNRAYYKRPLFDQNNRKSSDDQCLYRVFVKRR